MARKERGGNEMERLKKDRKFKYKYNFKKVSVSRC